MTLCDFVNTVPVNHTEFVKYYFSKNISLGSLKHVLLEKLKFLNCLMLFLLLFISETKAPGSSPHTGQHLRIPVLIFHHFLSSLFLSLSPFPGTDSLPYSCLSPHLAPRNMFSGSALCDSGPSSEDNASSAYPLCSLAGFYL